MWEEKMMIFSKALASLGVGAATVDTVLDHDTYTAGDLVQGDIHITGGNVEQHIDAIYLSLHINFTNKSGDKEYEDTATIFQKKLPSLSAFKQVRKNHYLFHLIYPMMHRQQLVAHMHG